MHLHCTRQQQRHNLTCDALVWEETGGVGKVLDEAAEDRVRGEGRCGEGEIDIEEFGVGFAAVRTEIGGLLRIGGVFL